MKNTLEWAHKNLDELKIKQQVDKRGIDGYIKYCAGLAATTGAASGLGGGVTLALGIPADIANSVAQQLRVTLAVIYDRTGDYSVSFEQLMKIVAVSLGVELGTRGAVVGANYLVNRIATELTKRLATRTVGRIVPIVGGVVGGTLNYTFIRAIGKSLLALDQEIFQ